MAKNKNITWQRVPASSLDLAGWKVAVVGGTGGLGRAISKVLASHGATVTVVGQTFRDQGVANLSFVKADLSLMSEARRVAKELPAEQLDLVVFTTGIIAAPKREETAEGIERDMAISYLSRLVILREIAPRLGTGRASPSLKPRVFVMGMPGTNQVGSPHDLNAEKSYAPMRVHTSTVAGNELLVIDAATRYSNATFFGLSPGVIKTNIRDNLFGKGSFKSSVIETMIGWFTPSPEKYAEGITPLLVSPDLERHSGAMFNQKGEAVEQTKQLTDGDYIASFLAASDALVARTRS
jgi:NAD(P)-dependent dehydrogenase (short-subunit alcohol dehydrogenase family)